MGPLTSNYVLCGSREANEGKLEELTGELTLTLSLFDCQSGEATASTTAPPPRLASGKASTLLASLALACAKLESFSLVYQDVNMRSYFGSIRPPTRLTLGFRLGRPGKKKKKGRWWAFGKVGPVGCLHSSNDTEKERNEVRGRETGKRVESIGLDDRLDDREKQNEIRIWPKKKQRYGYHDRSPSIKILLSKSLRVSGAFKHPKYAGVGRSLDKRIRSRIAFFVESSIGEKKSLAKAKKRLTRLIRLANDLRFAGTTKTTISLFPFFGATFFFPRDGVGVYTNLFFEDAREPLLARRAIIGQFHRAMSGQFRKNGKIWVRVLADLPITGKPTKVRMGRGKGNPTGWIARVSTGQILFEMDGVSLSNARQAATLAAHKPCSSTKGVSFPIGRKKWEEATETLLRGEGSEVWKEKRRELDEQWVDGPFYQSLRGLLSEWDKNKKRRQLHTIDARRVGHDYFNFSTIIPREAQLDAESGIPEVKEVSGVVWHLDVDSSHPGVEEGPKGSVVRRFKCSAGQLSWYGRTAAPREIHLYTSSRTRFLNRTSIGERCQLHSPNLYKGLSPPLTKRWFYPGQATKAGDLGGNSERKRRGRSGVEEWSTHQAHDLKTAGLQHRIGNEKEFALACRTYAPTHANPYSKKTIMRYPNQLL
ncbi:hypothetical protein AgCh_004762 [Apium graveolens]